MEKFTLLELHIHDGMEFSATNTGPAIGPAIGRSTDDDEEYQEPEARPDDATDTTDGDAGEETAGSGRSVRPLGLLAGMIALAALAFAIRKRRGADAELEIAELDDLAADADGPGEEGIEPEH
jgi:hypothetical protein